ncbi:hypothetical protein [Planotetraspora mira]|uniref:CMP/dCMP-type deaminase domain-containing protein n=1 Tax=Planotetraspora mira TaxID=58121 RepID=A0A8J3XA53_9ACTN|nr:hypothetical protein [Planotetraspora mira]GII32734.1 hypothetical protein Pmi06nite_61760 [Planotetraspora mira]
MEKGYQWATLHDANVIGEAIDECDGATLYITDEPCSSCLKLIRGAGVVRVVTPQGSVEVI